MQEITNFEKRTSEKKFNEFWEKKGGVEDQIVKLSEKIDHMMMGSRARDETEAQIANWNVPEAQKQIGEIAQVKLKEATEEILL